MDNDLNLGLLINDVRNSILKRKRVSERTTCMKLEENIKMALLNEQTEINYLRFTSSKFSS